MDRDTTSSARASATTARLASTSRAASRISVANLAFFFLVVVVLDRPCVTLDPPQQTILPEIFRGNNVRMRRVAAGEDQEEEEDLMSTELATRDVAGIQTPAPGTWRFDPAHTALMAEARHLMVTKVRGRFTDFSGTIHVAE